MSASIFFIISKAAFYRSQPFSERYVSITESFLNVHFVVYLAYFQFQLVKFFQKSDPQHRWIIF